MKSQLQMFREAEKRTFEANEMFMEFVKDGMTREELARNIERRPSFWKRFEHWLDKLPSNKVTN